MNRREFIKTSAILCAATGLNPGCLFAEKDRVSHRHGYLHPFIEAHPEAVFIKYTNVSVKTDSKAKKREGLELAKEIFTYSHKFRKLPHCRIAIKPNITSTKGKAKTWEGMGIITDCDFMEGLIDGMKEIGFCEDKIYMREGNWLGDAYCPGEYLKSPYIGLAERTGIHLTEFPTGRKIYQLTLDRLEKDAEVVWKDCPDGIVFKRIGYVAPFNQSDVWLLNVAKFKCHGMGMTLCTKNLQGMCVSPHIHFCEGVRKTKEYPPSIFKDFQPDLEEHIEKLYAQHLKAGIPRWCRPGRDYNSGYGMEMWAQRTCDSLSVTDNGLSIIEGIYGRDGNAFFKGPGPDGKAQDFLTNILIFGKNPFKVDIIGTWLGGHEPGNFGLFHIAKERGLCDVLNPMEIPIYRWDQKTPRLTSLKDVKRFQLKTPYLCKDYDGQQEPLYHLVDEPFDYRSVTSNKFAGKEKPEIQILAQNVPTSLNNSIIFDYKLPSGGNVALEIFNHFGDRVEVLEDGWRGKGAHMASWDIKKKAAGDYFYRFIGDGFEKMGKMLIAG